MLMWLEEAGVEIAMILATVIGTFMLVAAVWSLVSQWLRRGDQDSWSRTDS